MKYFLLLALLSPPAFALSPAQVKNILCPFRAKTAEKHFDHEFLEHGGAVEIQRTLQEYTQQQGKCLDVKSAANSSYEISFKNMVLPFELAASEHGKIKSIFFGPPRFLNDSVEKIVAELKKSPYKISFFASDASGKEWLAHDPDIALSISRSNQIFIARAVQEGQAKLSDLIPLDPKLVVRTFGMIQFWKPNTLLSVDTLMNLMISEKDLTASDLLLSRLDRSQFTQWGKSLSPFLSFREYFQLAEFPKKKLGSRTEVAKLVPELSKQPEPKEYRHDRMDLVGTIGWFASTRELCANALAVKSDILERNARLSEEYKAIQPKEIEEFGIVQSRDPGVSQVTAIFRVGSAWGCVALTANYEDDIEEATFGAIHTRLMNLAVAKAK